jgi:hypothetical protein
MSSLSSEVDRLYQLLEFPAQAIRSRYGRIPTPRDLSSTRTDWGTKGVYFIFEPGERRSSGDAERIVRVGTHLSDKTSIERRIVLDHATDWGLSVFRRHVGTALIREGAFDSEIPRAERDHWATGWFAVADGWAVHANPARLDPALHPLHPIVTRVIANMTIVWVEIPSNKDRRDFESQCISLLSNYLRSETPIDPASPTWLGRHALKDEVRRSGLWNVQHVKKPHRPGFLESYEKYFTRSE